ncbi:THAP-type domain-containing protein, partial [Aphis craccivora]
MAELLSHYVSASIKTCVATTELKSLTLDTAYFIDIVKNMFDSANSKNLYDPNPNRKPMCDLNPQVLENLENANKLFKNAIKQKNITTPPCFVGIVWTTNAISQLYESENLEIVSSSINKDYFLMTNKFTQNALNNLFSIMRQKNGYNRNPTARTFRCCFGHICTYSLMSCGSNCSNCELDEEGPLA